MLGALAAANSIESDFATNQHNSTTLPTHRYPSQLPQQHNPPQKLGSPFHPQLTAIPHPNDIDRMPGSNEFEAEKVHELANEKQGAPRGDLLWKEASRSGAINGEYDDTAVEFTAQNDPEQRESTSGVYTPTGLTRAHTPSHSSFTSLRASSDCSSIYSGRSSPFTPEAFPLPPNSNPLSQIDLMPESPLLNKAGLTAPNKHLSLTLEQRLANLDLTPNLDFELGASGEPRVKVSKKAQTLLGLNIDLGGNSLSQVHSRPVSQNSAPSFEEEKILLGLEDFSFGRKSENRQVKEIFPTMNRMTSSASAPQLNNSSRLASIPARTSSRMLVPESSLPSPARASTLSPPEPNLSRRGSAPSGEIAESVASKVLLKSPSLNLLHEPKERRNSILVGFGKLTRRKSSSASNNSEGKPVSPPPFVPPPPSFRRVYNGEMKSVPRSTSMQTCGSALADVDEDENSSLAESNLDGMDDDNDENIFNTGPQTSPVRPTGKAAKLLGIDKSAQILGIEPEIRSPPISPSSKSTRSKISTSPSGMSGTSSSASRRASEPSGQNFSTASIFDPLPKFPCLKAELPNQTVLGQVGKFSASSNSFLRGLQKKDWRARLLVLTIFPPDPSPEANTAAACCCLHLFKSITSSTSTSTELDRLYFTRNSIVCVPDENFGAGFALKVSGVGTPEWFNEFGMGPRPSKEWILGWQQVDEFKEWLSVLKRVVAGLNGNLENEAQIAPSRPNLTRTNSISSRSDHSSLLLQSSHTSLAAAAGTNTAERRPSIHSSMQSLSPPPHSMKEFSFKDQPVQEEVQLDTFNQNMQDDDIIDYLTQADHQPLSNHPYAAFAFSPESGSSRNSSQTESRDSHKRLSFAVSERTTSTNGSRDAMWASPPRLPPNAALPPLPPPTSALPPLPPHYAMSPLPPLPP